MPDEHEMILFWVFCFGLFSCLGNGCSVWSVWKYGSRNGTRLSSAWRWVDNDWISFLGWTGSLRTYRAVVFQMGSDASLTTETGGREVKPCNHVSAVLLSFNSLRISTNAVRDWMKYMMTVQNENKSLILHPTLLSSHEVSYASPIQWLQLLVRWPVRRVGGCVRLSLLTLQPECFHNSSMGTRNCHLFRTHLDIVAPFKTYWNTVLNQVKLQEIDLSIPLMNKPGHNVRGYNDSG